MKRKDLEIELKVNKAQASILDNKDNVLIVKALQAYMEQTGKNVIEWNWEEDAPSCIYTDLGDDFCDCYITRVEFDEACHITRIDLYAYYYAQPIENVDMCYMLNYKQDLAEAIIAELD